VTQEKSVFASIPSLEAQLLDKKRHTRVIIIDLTTVHRLETSAAQCFDRAVRDVTPRNTRLVFCGVRKGSGVCADFERAGVNIIFNGSDIDEKGIVAFETRFEAVEWCRNQKTEGGCGAEPSTKFEDITDRSNWHVSTDHQRLYTQFCDLFGYVPSVLQRGDVAVEEKRNQISDWEELQLAGARLTHYPPGYTLSGRSDTTPTFCSSLDTSGQDERIVFLLEGEAQVVLQTEVSYRPALYDLMLKLPREAFIYVWNRVVSSWTQKGTKKLFKPGDTISTAGLSDVYVVAQTLCSVVEVDIDHARQPLVDWTRIRHCG